MRRRLEIDLSPNEWNYLDEMYKRYRRSIERQDSPLISFDDWIAMRLRHMAEADSEADTGEMPAFDSGDAGRPE